MLKAWQGAEGCVCAVQQAALKAKGLRDDITVVVIDALPSEGQRLPPNARPSDASPAVVHCIADPSHCDSWHRHLW